MTDFSSVAIPPPKDWQAFERHSRLLFQYSLGDSQTQNNGRPGQRQHGVDIFGRRNGDGDFVGIQCKGKDADYGGAVTGSELRREVQKTEKFRPEIQEFILATTAPDDASVQEVARTLEEELRTRGRPLKVAVWGWGRLQQEISRFPEVVKAFHPDASPFTDLILDETRQIKELVKDGLRKQVTADVLSELGAQLAQVRIASVDVAPVADALDKHIHDEINTYRDMITDGRPQTAIQLLNALQGRLPETASNKIRFRILANIAAARHSLGEQEEAARLFLEAASFNPDDPIGQANKIAALIIQNHREEAHELAVAARAQHPDDPNIALQRLQALAHQETFASVWETFSEPVRNHEVLVAYRAFTLKHEGDATWPTILADALRRFPENRQLRAIKAQSTLERVLEFDRSGLGAPATDSPSTAELHDAARALQSLWSFSTERERSPDWASAHNAALALNLLGNVAAAAALLDEALAKGSTDEETKRFRIAIHLRAGEIAQASALAATLTDTSHNALYRADLLVKSDPPGARALLASRAEYTDRRDIIAAAQIYIDSLLTEESFDEAIVEAERLKAMLPDDPHPEIALYRVRAAQGDTNAGSHLTEALRKIRDDTDFVTRYLLAQALGSAGRFDQVVDLLHDHVETNHDSPGLREIVAAAANADRRSILRDLLSKIPGDVLELPYFRKARVALAIRTGEIRAAEDAIRSVLQVQPRSLEMHLQLLQVLARQEKDAELRAEAGKPAAEFDGRPEEFLYFAQFKDAYGDWREAYDLGYRTWLQNQSNPAVNLRYVGLFVRPGHSTHLEVSPATVAPGMAVRLRNQDGSADVFVIEGDPQLRPAAQYLAPTHAVAQLLLTRAVGDQIELPDDTTAIIDWIKPKELYALHEIMENFQRLFPESEGLERVQVRTDQPEGFQPIFDRVQATHEITEQLFDSYGAGNIPIALLASNVGRDPVATFLGLIEMGRAILVCEGTSNEREAAFSAIDANQARGCLVDAITLHVIYAFKLADAVKAVCGPISITDASVLRLQDHIREIEQRIDEPDMSLLWRNGQIFRQEVTPEEKRFALDASRRQLEWVQSEVKVVPAVAGHDPSSVMRDLIRVSNGEFADDLLAAQGAKLLFVSEDKSMRALAQVEFGLSTTWLQPILMRAVDARAISAEDYNAAVLHFIKSGFEFVSLQPRLLLWTLRGIKEVPLPHDFEQAARRLGGPKADLPSHIGVAIDVIGATWRDFRLSLTLRQAIVGRLLEELSKDRPLDHLLVILRALRTLAYQLMQAELLGYLRNWVRGHFIVLPPDSF